MFKIVEKPEFTHDVAISVPVDDGHAEEKLRTRFRVLPDVEADAFDMRAPEGQRQFLEAAVVGFSDLVDDKDKHLDCTPALRERLLDTPYIRQALVLAYVRAVAGARRGN